MAANTTLNTGTGGDVIRDIDRSGVKTQIVGLDLTPGAGSETLMDGTGLPTKAQAATRPAVTTMQNAATANGNGTSLDVTGQAVALLNIVSSPAMSGGTTVNFEASVDDTTWVSIAAHLVGTNGSLQTTTTADGDFRIQVAGYKSVRARISGYSAGTVTVKGYAVPTASAPTVVALAAGTNSIGAVTNAAASQADGHSATLGATSDADTATTGIGLWKKIKALLAGGLPAALAAGGGLKVEGVSGGVAQPVTGDVAHDATNAGNPSYQGAEAIAHGTNPTAVSAGDRTKLYANRAGVPFVIGGHPNIVTVEAAYTGAQTDTAIVTVSTGTKIVVTQVQVTCDNANTVSPQCRVGFGTANTPTTTGVVLTHPGIPAGGGVSRGDGSGILGIGADNEDLRITCGAPTGGSLRVLVSYYTIES